MAGWRFALSRVLWDGKAEHRRARHVEIRYSVQPCSCLQQTPLEARHGRHRRRTVRRGQQRSLPHALCPTGSGTDGTNQPPCLPRLGPRLWSALHYPSHPFVHVYPVADWRSIACVRRLMSTSTLAARQCLPVLWGPLPPTSRSQVPPGFILSPAPVAVPLVPPSPSRHSSRSTGSSPGNTTGTPGANGHSSSANTRPDVWTVGTGGDQGDHTWWGPLGT